MITLFSGIEGLIQQKML